MPAGRHARFDADAAAVRDAAAALDAFSASEGLPRETVWPLQVSLDEIVANIVSHAAVGRTVAGFDVWFRRDGESIEIVVADDGPPFDPLARASPDVTAPLEARQPGGLGIMLVKSLMDDVRYERTTRNVLTIRKRINSGDAPGGAGPDEHSAERSTPPERLTTTAQFTRCRGLSPSSNSIRSADREHALDVVAELADSSALRCFVPPEQRRDDVGSTRGYAQPVITRLEGEVHPANQ